MAQLSIWIKGTMGDGVCHPQGCNVAGQWTHRMYEFGLVPGVMLPPAQESPMWSLVSNRGVDAEKSC